MDSDHSEKEFYYPDEVENSVTKKTLVRNRKKTKKKVSLRWQVCKSTF